MLSFYLIFIYKFNEPKYYTTLISDIFTFLFYFFNKEIILFTKSLSLYDTFFII